MPLSFYSKPLDLQPLLKQADGIIAEVINGIKTKIQTAVDVSEIILTGGGAAFYKDGIAQNFKNKLVLMDDACYTNVKGFLISGDGVLLRAKKAV